MRKAIGLFVFGMIFLIALVGLSSAYYGGYYDPYYGAGKYDSYSSFTERTSGGYYGPRTTTTTAYDRVNEKYWDGYDWVDRTYYLREKRESPQYGGYGYPGYYQPYHKKVYSYPSYGYIGHGYNYPYSSYW